MSLTGKDHLKQELRALLAQNSCAITEALKSQYDRFTGGRGGNIVLCGAGVAGKAALRGLRMAGVEPRAFADNNAARWGQTIEGVPVISPADAAREFGETAAFVVTIYNGSTVRKQMRDLGCRTVVPFAPLFFKYSDVLLPHLNLDLPSPIFRNAGRVEKAFDLWADDESRAEYLAQLKYFTSLDPAVTIDKRPVEQTYFPPELIKVGEDEIFVDCGAYDGDTLRDFLKRCDGRFGRFIGIEPDPDSYSRLTEFAASVSGDVETCQFALGSETGVVQFEASGTLGSRLGTATGTISVRRETLDGILYGIAPTFIKIDIEGAEIEALYGARRVIERASAVLAVCLYHRQEDLWNVAIAIDELSNGRYRLHLRRHAEDSWETICYAIPPERTGPEVKREEVERDHAML